MFGFRLRVPARGDDITADWARELVKAVRSLRLHAGPGIRLTRTPDGTTISAPAAPSAAPPRKGTDHFGNAEDAEIRGDWRQSEEVPAILEIPDADGNVLVKILVDSRGNVVSWTSAEDGEEPDDPAARPPAPPTCGNPLNDDDDYNPLDDEGDGAGGGGGGGADSQDGYNPLDHEGSGGYTPECGKEP